jgi:excinuclease UvrABC ATPase subunit
MRNQFFLKIFVIIIVLFFLKTNIFGDDPPEFNYVGADACGKCHKSEKQGNQYSVWKESIHADAYKVLLSEEAISIAKELEYDKAPTELTECLHCHASGYEVDSTRLEKGFNIEDGVQCETCHGPGSSYKTMKIMKNRDLALQNGLVDVFTNTEELCTACHNPNSPTFSGFDFETMWAKIEHNIPIKKKEN